MHACTIARTLARAHTHCLTGHPVFLLLKTIHLCHVKGAHAITNKMYCFAKYYSHPSWEFQFKQTNKTPNWSHVTLSRLQTFQCFSTLVIKCCTILVCWWLITDDLFLPPGPFWNFISSLNEKHEQMIKLVSGEVWNNQTKHSSCWTNSTCQQCNLSTMSICWGFFFVGGGG